MEHNQPVSVYEPSQPGSNTSGNQNNLQPSSPQAAIPAQSAPPAAALKYIGIGKRFVAQIIDGLIWFAGFGFALGLLFGQTTDKGFNLTGGPAFLPIILAFVYFIVFEAKFGATPGKMVLKLRVVRENGASITLSESIIRNLLRIVDYLPFLYILGAFLVYQFPQKNASETALHTLWLYRNNKYQKY